uniref:Uncharacterized protein n=1 Tax=Romanomermis culicivorax TaxID=13658 RepID=A0A915K1R2_ROMCU
MTVTSKPTPFKNPPHSNETYEAPTSNVLPGGYFNIALENFVTPLSLNVKIACNKIHSEKLEELNHIS